MLSCAIKCLSNALSVASILIFIGLIIMQTAYPLQPYFKEGISAKIFAMSIILLGISIAMCCFFKLLKSKILLIFSTVILLGLTIYVLICTISIGSWGSDANSILNKDGNSVAVLPPAVNDSPKGQADLLKHIYENFESSWISSNCVGGYRLQPGSLTNYEYAPLVCKTGSSGQKIFNVLSDTPDNVQDAAIVDACAIMWNSSLQPSSMTTVFCYTNRKILKTTRYVQIGLLVYAILALLYLAFLTGYFLIKTISLFTDCCGGSKSKNTKETESNNGSSPNTV